MRHARMEIAEERIRALDIASGGGALLAMASVFGKLSVHGLDRRIDTGVDVAGGQYLVDRFVDISFRQMRRPADVRIILQNADAATVYLLGHLIQAAGCNQNLIANAVRDELHRRGFEVYMSLFRATLDMPDGFDGGIYLSYDMVDILYRDPVGNGPRCRPIHGPIRRARYRPSLPRNASDRLDAGQAPCYRAPHHRGERRPPPRRPRPLERRARARRVARHATWQRIHATAGARSRGRSNFGLPHTALLGRHVELDNPHRFPPVPATIREHR